MLALNIFSIQSEKLCVKFGGNDFIAILNVVKNIQPKGRYNPNAKQWEFNSSQYHQIKESLEKFDFVIHESIANYFSNLEIEKQKILDENEQAIEFIRQWLKANWIQWDMKPYKHQLDVIKFFVNRPSRFKGILISDDMGLGKTLSAILCVESYRHWLSSFAKSDLAKIVIVCPAFLKSNWQTELSKLQITDGSIFSYEKAPDKIDGDFLLIVDESHYTQNPKSKRSKKLLELGLSQNCKGVVCLSGTPMPNGRPYELFNTLKLLRHPVADNKSAFEKRYCDAHPTAFTNWDISGVSNLDEFKEIISNVNIRRLKSDCLDLPEKKIIELYTDNDKEDLQEYKDFIEVKKQEYFEKVENLEISDDAQAMVFIGIYRQAASILKSKYAIKITQDFNNSGEPVVIFTDFIESAELIAKHFGVKAITGKVKHEDRRKIIDDFQAGLTQVFVSTCGSSGVGVTLTKSSNLIMVDRCWTPGKNNQVYDRIHRIGQKNTCFIFNLMSGVEICEFMAGLNGAKSKIIDKLFKTLHITPITTKGESIKHFAQFLMK